MNNVSRQNFPDFEARLAKSDAALARQPHLTASLHASAVEPEGQLTIDVYQTPSDIVVESAIAGVNPDDLEINVSNDSVTIRGQRQHESQVQDEDYLYQECYWGKFSRSIILPQEVDPETAAASFKNGILTVRLPKLSREKTKKLNVRFE
jgi:HSP20 family protein